MNRPSRTCSRQSHNQSATSLPIRKAPEIIGSRSVGDGLLPGGFNPDAASWLLALAGLYGEDSVENVPGGATTRASGFAAERHLGLTQQLGNRGLLLGLGQQGFLVLNYLAVEGIVEFVDIWALTARLGATVGVIGLIRGAEVHVLHG